MRFKWLVGMFVTLLTFAFGNAGGGVAHAASATKLSDVIASTSGYGSYVTSNLANLRSGPTASTSVSCTAAAPVARTKSGAAVTVPGLGNVSATTTTANTSVTATSKTTEATSTTAGVDLLGGLITSETLKSTSKVTVSSTGVATASGSSTLTGLKVGGVSIAANPAPNTKVELKVGSTVIGKVVINEQSRSTGAWSGQMMARALSVYILTGNTLGLPVGTRIIVGHTSSALKAAPAGVVGGEGFAVRAKLADGVVKSGPHVQNGMHCLGGTRTVSAAAIDVSGLVSTGAAKTVTESSVGESSRSSAETTVAGVKLLGGLISVDAVTANSSTTRSAAGQPVQTTNASKVTNLRLLGLPVIDGTVEPNTRLHIPGVATVTVNKVVKTASGITVTMLEIKLEKLLGGLPTGSILEIGYSRTSVS